MPEMNTATLSALSRIGITLSPGWEAPAKPSEEMASASAASLINVEPSVKATTTAVSSLPKLSDEQQKMVDVVKSGKDVIVDATVGSGKALTNDSRVPTPLGWRRVGDIEIGDELYTRRGTSTKVVGVFPQGEQDVYRVTLADGREVLCSGDHNWSVRRTARRLRVFEVLTTTQMLEKGTKRSEGRFECFTYRIPNHVLIEMKAIDHSVHPYVVGALLGNGCLTEKYLSISCETDAVPRRIADLAGLTFRRRSLANYTWDFLTRDGKRVRTDQFLVDFPEMVGLSGAKSVPETYLRGSSEQRLDLVRGLMDTDGSIARAGGRFTVSFSTTSTALAQAMRDVLGSLGHVVAMGVDNREEKYGSGVCHALGINVANADKASLFSVGPKAELAVEAAMYSKRRDYSEVSIASIEKLNYRAEMTCFQVEDDEHLFLADNYVVTHNTTAIQALCAEVGSDQRVLYLTYSKLLKADAQHRVGSARVQNYHGIVYPSLRQANIRCGISESIRAFNDAFKELSAGFPVYDLLVVDEYQDINEEHAQLLRNIKSTNPLMQVVMVGDMEQKVKSDTTLDVQLFVREFCDDPVRLPFTRSFRVGKILGGLLGKAWDKPVVGVNDNQRMCTVTYDEAVSLIKDHTPGDLLCLGKRNGLMSRALNQVEQEMPTVFNKSTIYASIRDGDMGGTYGKDAAVFTTFDSSKGLERKVCVVFDYEERNWDVRNNFSNADAVVLRNVFLVAASRGKDEVVFVKSDNVSVPSGPHIGLIPIKRFTTLPGERMPVYKNPFLASDAFDFKYAENVDACFRLLDVRRLDDGTAPVIDITREDGLIDLSPAVGHYQEAVFFTDYDPRREIAKNTKPIALEFLDKLDDDFDEWSGSLMLTAVDTDQRRYADQVTAKVPAAAKDALVSRLSSLLPQDCRSQVLMSLQGRAMRTKAKHTPIAFTGVADAVYDGQIFELKFVTELSQPMFLQLGLYLMMSGLESGVLWNTRTDERWEVRVPDRNRFMNAVALCVTKQAYKAFEGV